MHDVFISYARADREWVQALDSALASHGISTWLDVRDIPVSTLWLDEIADAIDESYLFLRCESVSRRASVACASEDQVAADREVAQCGVLVDDDLEATLPRVFAALERVGTDERAARGLLVRARDWDRAGRPSRDLLGPREVGRLNAARHRFAQQSRSPGALWVTSDDFMHAAQRRHRVRRRLLVGVVVSLVLLGVSSALVKEAQQQYSTQLDSAAATFEKQATLLGLIGQRAYPGLGAVSVITSVDGDADADMLEAALARPVPDDAFSVPGGAIRFTASPIDDAVRVASASGATYERAADAAGQRAADRAPSPPSGGERRIGPQGLSASVDPERGRVTIVADGRLSRTATVRDAEDVTAFSPDGRWLAVAQTNGIAVLEVETGIVRMYLAETPGAISDIAWTADATRVWAVVGGQAVRWTFSSARTLVSEQGGWFQGVGHSADPHAVWLATRTGDLREIDTTSGATTATVALHDTTYAVQFDAGGTSAFVSGHDHDWLLDLGARSAVPLDLPDDCTSGGAAFGGTGGTIALACTARVVLLDAASHAVVDTVDLSAEVGRASIKTLAYRGDSILAGTSDGKLMSIDPSGRWRLLTQLECHPDLAGIAVSSKGDVLPVGDGSAYGTCQVIGVEDDGLTWAHVAQVLPRAISTLSATFDASGGQAVMGYYDGTLVVRPTEHVVPSLTINSIPGGIRGMTVIDGTLYIATRAGVLQTIELPAQPLTNRDLASVAAERLARAHAIGLAPAPPQ